MPALDPLELTEHHLYPRVHRRHLPHNTVNIPRGVHQAWHLLVNAAPPEQALAEFVQFWLDDPQLRWVYLRTRFWSGRIRPVRCGRHNSPKLRQAFTLVFPTERPLEIIGLWVWRWTPKEYVTEVSVRLGQNVYDIYPDRPDSDLIAKIERRQGRKLVELRNAHHSH